jgi:dihydropteroate synthase
MRRFMLLLLLGVLGILSIGAEAPPGFARSPAILTSVGQSADVEMIRVLMNRARLEFTMDVLVDADDLSGEYGTLVIVIGGSSKGLGAAGISADAEMERAEALIDRARDLDMAIIAVHVGGEARRGALSDGFIELGVTSADYAIAVEAGDKDGLISSLADDAGVPLTLVPRISGVGSPLAASFE